MSAPQASCLLYFDDEEAPALRLSQAAGLTALAIERHRFPDGELKLRLPVDDTGCLPQRAVLLRSLHQPNEKLVELLLAARTARSLGVQHLTLVAPYLAYMRQDIAFHSGEAVSQQVVGGFLAGLFDAVITVDPHLHRIDRLEQAIPVPQAVVLSGAEPLADLIAQRRPNALLVGPDGESAQWIAQAAARHGFDHAVCTKVRHGDRNVAIELPALNAQGRAVVLLDDMASTGRTLALAARWRWPHAGAGRAAAAAGGGRLGGRGRDACVVCGRCIAGDARRRGRGGVEHGLYSAPQQRGGHGRAAGGGTAVGPGCITGAAGLRQCTIPLRCVPASAFQNTHTIEHTMLLDPTESQLVLVDYQERLMPAIHEGPAVLANARRLAEIARMLDVPVWGTEQNPSRLGANDAALRALCQKTLAKMHFSAAEEGLGEWLRPPAKPQGGNARSLPKHLQKPAQQAPERGAIVIAGCEAHVCLLQTALDLIDDEFEVWVVTDACGSRTERNRDAAFDRLAGAGAELVTTEMVAFEWLGSCEHPAFKDVLGLIK